MKIKPSKQFLTIISLTIAILVLVPGLGYALPLTIEVTPSSSVVTLGHQITVGLRISGLGSGSAPSLSEFDLDLGFDLSKLSFVSANYGDPVLGDQLDLAGFGASQLTTPNLSSVNLFELSFDSVSDLDNLQADQFIMVSVTFDTLALGGGNFALALNSLADASGGSLTGSTTLTNGSFTITAVPAPPTLTLVVAGIMGLMTSHRKFCSQQTRLSER